MQIDIATSPVDIEIARPLLCEYATTLGAHLCFQSFERELAELPGEYAPPHGRLLLARVDAVAAGCLAIRSLTECDCEMRRMYVRPAFRGRHLGRALATRAVAEAREIGYRRIFLSTLPSMTEAVGLYRSMGFESVTPYYLAPDKEALYLALDL